MVNDLKIEERKKQPDKDSFLYRYVTIDKLFDFLLCERIPLARLDSFSDKLEGAHMNSHMWNKIGDEFSDHEWPMVGLGVKFIANNFAAEGKKSLNVDKELFRKSNYASCWYVNNHESVAMWDLYSRSDSVAIKIPLQKLVSGITDRKFILSVSNVEKITYGSLEYYRFNNLNEISEVISKNDIRGFVKDKSFEHEQEFRINVKVIHDKKSLVLPEVIYFHPHDFKEIPFEIIFHPKSLLWHQENVSKIMSKFDLPFKMSKSSLRNIF